MAPPSSRVYVGNLAWRVRWADLKDHMRSAGSVIRADVFEDRDGRSQGCGIVEYENPADAQRAIEELTDTELLGRKIFVREDREEGSGSRGRGGRGGFGSPRGGYDRGGYDDRSYGGGRYDDRGFGGGRSRDRESSRGGGDDTHGRQVFVGNLSWDTKWQDLKDLFREVGDVVRADVYHEPDGRSKGCGTVLFASSTDAENAIEKLNDTEVQGRTILVRLDQGPPRGGRGGRGYY